MSYSEMNGYWNSLLNQDLNDYAYIRIKKMQSLMRRIEDIDEQFEYQDMHFGLRILSKNNKNILYRIQYDEEKNIFEVQKLSWDTNSNKIDRSEFRISDEKEIRSIIIDNSNA